MFDLFESLFGFNKDQNLEATIKRMELLKQKYGGEVKITEETIKRVTVSHIGEDGGITSQVILVMDDVNVPSPNSSVDPLVKIKQLQKELQISLEKEDYKACAEIKKQIEELENGEQ